MKGLSLFLTVALVSGFLPAIYANASSSWLEDFFDQLATPTENPTEDIYKVNITEEDAANFYYEMISEGYTNTKYGKAKKRISILNAFLNDLNNNLLRFTSDSADDYELDESAIKWNPSQKDVDDGRDLYFIEWVNGDGYTNPGEGYEILSRIVYITTSGQIRYTTQFNLDKYPRKLLGFGLEAQWDNKRINHCSFALPDDCLQIVGVLMSNEAGGGDNNDTWWMDYLYIYRITSDNVNHISAKYKNKLNHDQVSFTNGELVAFASNFDITQRYLDGDDTREEWLYLLRNVNWNNPASGSDYYAQIVTGDNDLSGKGLKMELSYLDVTGVERTYTQIIDDSEVVNFYPQLTFPENFDKNNNFKKGFGLLANFHQIRGYATSDDSGTGIVGYQWKYLTGDKYISNKIAMEIPKTKNWTTQRSVIQQLESYGSFHNYSWEESNTSATNLYAFTLFGNYVDYDQMTADILGPRTATDINLDAPYDIKEIKELRLSMASGAGGAELQDIRIYSSSPQNFERTRMNGGISTERIFYDVKDAICLMSVDTSTPIRLSGDGVYTFSQNPEPNNQRHYKLIQHDNKRMSLMAEDDNLGIQISLADVYNAGYEIFMAYVNEKYYCPELFTTNTISPNMGYDKFNKVGDIRTGILDDLPDLTELLDEVTALEILNLMESYYKESLTLNIRYIDEFGAHRDVEVPFITSYLLQIYSDNGGKLGIDYDTLLTGILQQGEDTSLRIPLSQFQALESISVSFGSAPSGVTNFKNNKYFYYNDPDIEYVFEGSWWVTEEYSWDRMWNWWESTGRYYQPHLLDRWQMEQELGTTESVLGGKTIPTGETISIRAIRLYENVTKEEFYTLYDPYKRVTQLSTSKTSDYYYKSKDKKGTSFAIGSQLKLSVSDSTLTKGVIDYFEADLKNMYLVEMNTHSLYNSGNDSSQDLYVTLAYTTTSGEEKKISSQPLSYLSKDYFGGNNIRGRGDFEASYEPQTMEALNSRNAYFLLELDDVSRFDYIHLSVPDGETNGVQINSISIYELDTLSQRFSSSRRCSLFPIFARNFTGDKVAYNNKAIALQPNREGFTFYFTKINSDGTEEGPDTEIVYQDEYLTIPPTSMTYEETLKDLGLAVTKYTYTVDVDVANVLDAGSSNYFYFQLVFENGTSGVVLANQQLASDSFRQGYTESFTINTTQNYGNVTAVRVICDTSSSTSQAFDKLNIETITVSLPSNSSAKSWIIDRVGWIDINFQDEGVATTVSEDARGNGFPNSQVVKEFPRTRTASTARLLFTISTAADSPNTNLGAKGSFEGSLAYEDTAGYIQNYNFNLRSVMYNFMENENSSFLFRPNISNSFTLSINDIASVKSLNIYRSDGADNWIIKDATISQFSDMGNVYKSTTGELKRYTENEKLLATSSNSNITIAPSGTGTLTFSDHSIAMDTLGNDPSTWSTTITRLPATTQESLNVYLYAGTSDGRTYTFDTANLPAIKGRMEYSLKEGGSFIGSTSFSFTDSAVINGTTVLRASGVKITGMNQLKTLHLETSSTSAPIISGARVERIRGNTIVETLYFDYSNASMTAGHNYSAIAKADTLSSLTKQTLALQLTGGQDQLFTASSDVAVALLYTSENSASDSTKNVYTSPYIFFTDAGITSLGNTSILEIPFNISGVDQITGISIASNGPTVKFKNAIVYNYVENATGERTLIDTCQIAEEFSSSVIEKQLGETANNNVTPVTLTFTTSDGSRFPGAGSSGRLPVTIRYQTLSGKEETLEFNNLTSLLPANTLPTAGSSVSFNVQLSDFSHFTSIDLKAIDDDWHLNKVSAEINKLINAVSTSYTVEAFVDQWITSRNSVTAVFGNGTDSTNTQNQIVSFSVTGRTSKSGNTATATSGNVLMIKAVPGENVTFTPQVTANGNPSNTVIWDTSTYGSYMFDGGNNGLILRVPNNSVGQMFIFSGYCSFDTQKSVTVAVEVVNGPATGGSGTTGGGDTAGDDGTADDDNSTTEQNTFVDVAISVTDNSLQTTNGPAFPSFFIDEDTSQDYTIFVKPGEYVGTWNFNTTAPSDYTVTFTDSPELQVTNTSGGTKTMICTNNSTGKQFKLNFNVTVVQLKMTITATGDGITPTSAVLTADTSTPFIFEIPNSTEQKMYTLQLSVNNSNAKAIFSNAQSTLTFSNKSTLKTDCAICTPVNGFGQSFAIPITFKLKE